MIASLEVHRGEFLEALRVLERTTDTATRGTLALSYAHGELVLELVGASGTAMARGTWSGVALADTQAAFRLVAEPPEEDPVRITMEEYYLDIADRRISAIWYDGRRSSIDTALDPSRIELLRYGVQFPRAELDASPLNTAVRDAERWRDGLIERAAFELAPLGVTTQDVEAIVASAIFREP